MKKVNVLKHISEKLNPEQIEYANNEIKKSLQPLILKYKNNISINEIPFDIHKKGENPLLEKLKYGYNRDGELSHVYIYSDHHYENELDTKNLLQSLLYRHTTFSYSYFEVNKNISTHISYFDFHDGTAQLIIPPEKYKIRPSERLFMKKNEVNIEFLNDKKLIKNIFDGISNQLKPAWLAVILSYFDYYLKEVPTVVTELIDIIDDENSWHKAKYQAYKIAKYRIKMKDISIENYLRFAEKVAYITDDIFNNRNNFNEKSCIELVKLANEAGQYCTENHFIIYDLNSGFTLFYYEDELKNLIQTTDDFRIFRIIDDVIWRDWDPLDFNTRWFRNEYLIYIPEIFKLVKNNESVYNVAKYLKKLTINQFEYFPKPFRKLKRIARLMKG